MKTAITGSIGAGKTYVCQMLRQRGIDVYDCDSAAKRIMRTDPDIRRRLTSLIGPQAYRADGTQDKAVIAQFLLASKAGAEAINQIVHPAVASDYIASGLDYMECALLFQAGFDRLVQRTIAVTAPEELRISRITRRDNITPDKAREWIAAVWPQEEIARRADIVIINDGRPIDIKQITNT